MDDTNRHIRNSPEHLLRMLGIGDDKELFLERPHKPQEQTLTVSLKELERDVRNRGFAYLSHIDGDKHLRIIFVDFDEHQHECVSLDFDYTMDVGTFFFGFVGQKGFYWMQPKDMREHGFRFASIIEERRIAVGP